jgi:hypothetical protein
MPQIRIWAVIGAGNVGKSTTIGHLAGDFGKGQGGLRQTLGGKREVLLRGGGYLTVFSWRVSRQDAGQSPDETVKFLKRQSSQFDGDRPIASACFNVLVALRTDRRGNLPVAAEYLSHFVRQGWIVESLALLSPTDRDEDLYHRFGAPTCYVYGSRDIKIAWMVGQVRNHFGWA